MLDGWIAVKCTGVVTLRMEPGTEVLPASFCHRLHLQECFPRAIGAVVELSALTMASGSPPANFRAIECDRVHSGKPAKVEPVMTPAPENDEVFQAGVQLKTGQKIRITLPKSRSTSTT